ncbi:box C/D snoRNA protein 1-like [Mya arenaria]|uniref:box C/D snoRNA protein 1-like n=1 Tax=Mya arenaria TaxID=6604 RepID=UPI0022E65535|nr:box C/D snoRNA protein 1-like [Mya arenaria]
MKSCAICEETEAKYRCPACEVETCCLQCVREHKSASGCTGVREKAAYVPLSDFRDIHLLSDYRFLEDGGRKTNNAARDQLKRSSVPNFLRTIETQAKHRGVRLRLMPYPMTKRKTNSTYYQYKSKTLHWHVEWEFPEINYTTTDRRVPEITPLREVLAKHTGDNADPIEKHRLQAYIDGGEDGFRVFMKQTGTKPGQDRFYSLDLDQTLSENLKDKEIVEYPTLVVVQRKNWDDYSLVTDDSSPEVQQEDPVKEESTSSVQQVHQQNDTIVT